MAFERTKEKYPLENKLVHIIELLFTAYKRCTNVTSGFRNAWTFPYDRNIFTDLDSVPAIVHKNVPVVKSYENSAATVSEKKDVDAEKNNDADTDITEEIQGIEI